MLSPQLRRKVHDLWSLFWSSGLSNPLVAIEQITYLLFIRQLESLDRERVKQGKASIYAWEGPEDDAFEQEARLIADKETELTLESAKAMLRQQRSYEKCRWSYIRQNPGFSLLNDTVFPWLRTLEQRVGPAQNGNATLGRISGRLSDAYFILDVNKEETLKRAVSLIDELFRQLDTRSANSDIMGDIFEYLLEEVKESGKNGQFRTPRHVIRFMVELLKPELGKIILDPACGSGGFLINSLLYWKAEHTDKQVLRLEWDGTPHDVLPVWLEGEQHDFSALFRGYDNDRTVVRIAWMNLLLHDLESPEVHQLDALSKRLKEEESGTYDYILANPPFTGSVDEGDLSESRQRFPREGKGKKATSPITTKSELLFVWLMLDLLKIGGRAAVIVPDGVLFGNTKAHRELRRQLLFENTLEAVVSLPANMFQPYSGVKTSILLFQKAGTAVSAGTEPRTTKVWFYEITDEAYSLDQRRKALYGQDNDFWDALVKFDAWNRFREGETSSEAAAIAKEYHQPNYWEERWRSVDDEQKPKVASPEPNPNQTAETLAPQLIEFAKLDGYNVWRRGLVSLPRTGKRTSSDEDEPQHVPTLLSWIVPVRQWAELESWGEDPDTNQPIAKPTHKDAVLDPEYFAWLRDTLKIFDDDATVKEDFLDRLDSECLEALDFNLSAGRHKPFVFDPGQHRPPAELICELQAIHGEVQKRLGKLLSMVRTGE